ncbi:MAG: hypothetical protein HKN76_19450 [Saprospiraceae bacterium]|nr:hypothetical protein [Saprospiraceae bacterium]
MRKFSSIVLIFIILSFSCQERDEAIIAELMEKRVAERLSEYIRVEKERCQERLLDEASVLVDSILRANPIEISLDSLQRPPVPFKPVKPDFERPKDSIKISPIIPLDTALRNQ